MVAYVRIIGVSKTMHRAHALQSCDAYFRQTCYCWCLGTNFNVCFSVTCMFENDNFFLIR